MTKVGKRRSLTGQPVHELFECYERTKDLPDALQWHYQRSLSVASPSLMPKPRCWDFFMLSGAVFFPRCLGQLQKAISAISVPQPPWPGINSDDYSTQIRCTACAVACVGGQAPKSSAASTIHTRCTPALPHCLRACRGPWQIGRK